MATAERPSLQNRLTARLDRYDSPADRALARVARHSGSIGFLGRTTGRRLERTARWENRVALRSAALPSIRRRMGASASAGRSAWRSFGSSLLDAAFVESVPPWLLQVEEPVPVAQEVWTPPRPTASVVQGWGAFAGVPGSAPVARTRAGALSRSSGIAPPSLQFAAAPRTPDTAPTPATAGFASAALSATPLPAQPVTTATVAALRRGVAPLARLTRATTDPTGPVARAEARAEARGPLARGTGRFSPGLTVGRAVSRAAASAPSGRGFAVARHRSASRSAGPSTAPLGRATSVGATATSTVARAAWSSPGSTALVARQRASAAASTAPLARASARTARAFEADAGPVGRIASRTGLAPSEPGRTFRGLTRQPRGAAQPFAAPVGPDATVAPSRAAAPPTSTALRAAARFAPPAAPLQRAFQRSVGGSGPRAVREASSLFGRTPALLSSSALAVAAPAPEVVLAAAGAPVTAAVEATSLAWGWTDPSHRPLTRTGDPTVPAPPVSWPQASAPIARATAQRTAASAPVATTRALTRQARPETAARFSTPPASSAIFAASTPTASQAVASRRSAPTPLSRLLESSPSVASSAPVSRAAARASEAARPWSAPASTSPVARTLGRSAVPPTAPTARRRFSGPGPLELQLPDAPPSFATPVAEAAVEPTIAPTAAPPAPTAPVSVASLPAASAPLGAGAFAGLTSTARSAATPASRRVSPASRALQRFEAPESTAIVARAEARRITGPPAMRLAARRGLASEPGAGFAPTASLSVAAGLGRQVGVRQARRGAFDAPLPSMSPEWFAPTVEAAAQQAAPAVEAPAAPATATPVPPVTFPAPSAPVARTIARAFEPSDGPSATPAARRTATASPLSRAFERAGLPSASAPIARAGGGLPQPSATVAVSARALARTASAKRSVARARPLTGRFDPVLPSIPPQAVARAEVQATPEAFAARPVTDDAPAAAPSALPGSSALRAAAAGPAARSTATVATSSVARALARASTPAAQPGWDPWTGAPVATPVAGLPWAGAPTAATGSSPYVGASLSRTASHPLTGAPSAVARSGGWTGASTADPAYRSVPGAARADASYSAWQGAPAARRTGFRRAASMELVSFAGLPPAVAQPDVAPVAAWAARSVDPATGAVITTPTGPAGSTATRAAARSADGRPPSAAARRSASLPLPTASAPLARGAVRSVAGSAPRGLARALQRDAETPSRLEPRSPVGSSPRP